MWNGHTMKCYSYKNVVTLEDNLALFYKIEHIPTTWSSNRIPGYLLKGFESVGPNKNLHTDVRGNFAHNYKDLEVTKMPSAKWTDADNGILLSTKKW
jgi:hypothetical protein